MSTPELTLCPHCGGMTVVVPDARARFVCGACGGPRVPGASGKNAALAKARQLQAAAFGWSAGAIALALTGAMTSGLAALLWAVAQGIGVVVGLMGVVAFLFAWRSSARAGMRRKEAAQAIDDGWREAVRGILAARGRDTTAAELAAVVKIDEAEADRFLTDLAAHDEARVDIESGSVKFRVPSDEERAREEAAVEEAAREEADDAAKEKGA